MSKAATIQQIIAILEKQSRRVLIAIGLICVLLLGIIDYITGYEISFALFYLLPVSLVAWFCGKTAGIFVSFVSAATWSISNYLAGETFSSSLIPYWNSITRLGFFVIVTLLLSELRNALAHEKDLSRIDFLTGALNRRAFYEIATAEMLKTSRYHHPFTVVYIDLDNFKTVNDSYGHSTGDTLLRTVVRTIKENVRTTDSTARLGGDEFVILLLEADQEAARNIITRLHKRLLDEMVQNDWPVTFSIGVSTYLAVPETIDEIIRQADQLMYGVKNSGKNAVRYATWTG